MEDCCEWHGKMIAQDIKEIKHGHDVNAAIYFCPECNSLWKSFIGIGTEKEFLKERLWGERKETCLEFYKEEIALIKQ